MSPKEKTELKKLIGENRLKELLDILLYRLEYYVNSKTYSNKEIKVFFNDAISISSRYNKNIHEGNLRLISRESKEIEFNRIGKAVSALIDNFPNHLQPPGFEKINEDDNSTIQKIKRWKIANQPCEYDFFFCYYKELDFEVVRPFYEKLRGLGFKVILSKDIQSSVIFTDYKESLSYAINASQAMIVFGTDNSINDSQDSQPKFEYETFYKQNTIEDSAKRPIYILDFQKNIKKASLPEILQNAIKKKSLDKIIQRYLSLEIKNVKLSSSANRLVELQKEGILNNAEQSKKKVYVCPKCTFPVKEEEYNGNKILFLFITAGLLMFLLVYQTNSIWIALFSALGGGGIFALVGMFLIMTFEFFLNIYWVQDPPKCSNCQYLLPRDQLKLYNKYLERNSLKKRIKQLNNPEEKKKVILKAILEENSKAYKCKKCSFPVHPRNDVNDRSMGLIIGLSTIFSMLYAYQFSHTWWLVLVVFVISWLILIFFSTILLMVIELIINKDIFYRKSACINCSKSLSVRGNNSFDSAKELVFSDSISSEDQKKLNNIQKKYSSIRKCLKEDDIPKGLTLLSQFFRSEQENYYAEKSQMLDEDYDRNLVSRNLNKIPSEVYQTENVRIINSANDLMDGYLDYFEEVAYQKKGDKNFEKNSKKLYDLLLKAKAEKFHSTFIKFGYTYNSFKAWVLSNKDLEKMDIPDKHHEKIIKEFMDEKNEAMPKILLVIGSIIGLGILSILITFLNYYNFNWSGLVTGWECTLSLFGENENLSFYQWLFQIIPALDIMAGVAYIYMGLMLLYVMLNPSNFYDGGVKSNKLILLNWLVITTLLVVPIWYTLLFLIAHIPITYYIFFQDDANGSLNYLQYLLKVYEVGFLIRLIPYFLSFKYLRNLDKYIDILLD